MSKGEWSLLRTAVRNELEMTDEERRQAIEETAERLAELQTDEPRE